MGEIELEVKAVVATCWSASKVPPYLWKVDALNAKRRYPPYVSQGDVKQPNEVSILLSTGTL